MWSGVEGVEGIPRGKIILRLFGGDETNAGAEDGVDGKGRGEEREVDGMDGSSMVSSFRVWSGGILCWLRCGEATSSSGLGCAQTR